MSVLVPAEWCPKQIHESHVLSCAPQTPWDAACDVLWDEAMRDIPEECEPEWIDAEDPLFILHTSGSTGKPKVTQIGEKYFQQKDNGPKRKMLLATAAIVFPLTCRCGEKKNLF